MTTQTPVAQQIGRTYAFLLAFSAFPGKNTGLI